MLRWSDGSVSLQLGSDLFDVAPSHGATLARPSDPEPETTRGPSSQPEAPTSNSSTTFICVAADTERVLITETAVAGQLSLVPTSMTSKTHLELAKHVGRQHVKHSRMKILDDMHDPAKMNELLLKASGVKPKARSSRTGERSRKKRAVSDESDGRVQAEQPRSKRIDEGEYDEDDGFVVADSDNEGENTDEAAYGATKKKGKKTKGKKRKGSEELDEMEEAERRIEERERERKRAKKGSSAGANGAGARKKKSGEYVDSEEDAEGEEEMEMDVESEDD